jgi:hypothetical protein
VLVAVGVVVFAAGGQWLWLGLMVLIEAVFVLAFTGLLAQARNRRSS